MTTNDTKQKQPKAKPAPRGKAPSPNQWHGGPVKLRATDEQLATVTRLRAQGSTERGIALAAGVSWPTFLRWKKEDERVAEALDRGFEQLHDSLVNTLLKKAQGGDTIALIYATKSLIGLRDNDPPQESRVNISISLPGASATRDDYRRAIDVTPQRPALSQAVPQRVLARALPKAKSERGDG